MSTRVHGVTNSRGGANLRHGSSARWKAHGAGDLTGLTVVSPVCAPLLRHTVQPGRGVMSQARMLRRACLLTVVALRPHTLRCVGTAPNHWDGAQSARIAPYAASERAAPTPGGDLQIRVCPRRGRPLLCMQAGFPPTPGTQQQAPLEVPRFSPGVTPRLGFRNGHGRSKPTKSCRGA